MQDRIQIIPGDIMDHPEVVDIGDVFVFNNVFEFFVPPETQARIWTFLRSRIKKGALIVTTPSLEDMFHHLKVSINNSVSMKNYFLLHNVI